jgi:hypothetical protein
MQIKNVQHTLSVGFAHRSAPPFHHHFIIHPVLFILCLINVERTISLIIPVAFIIGLLRRSVELYVFIEQLTKLN